MHLHTHTLSTCDAGGNPPHPPGTCPPCRYPEAWYLPDATNIPAGYASTGAWWATFAAKAAALRSTPWAPGSATSTYPNQQRPTTLWYHDHALGLTRANVYAGMTGFYLIKAACPANGAATTAGQPSGSLAATCELQQLPELPLAIQDRMFDTAGQVIRLMRCTALHRTGPVRQLDKLAAVLIGAWTDTEAAICVCSSSTLSTTYPGT